MPGAYIQAYIQGLIGSFALVAVYVELLLAAAIDARECRFPNSLACCLAVSCAMAGLMHGGPGRLVTCLAASAALGVALLLFEVGWRGVNQGRAGLGMGDIKFACALSLWTPVGAVASMGVGLTALALACAVLRKPSLPLLPFAVPAFMLMRCAAPLFA